MADNFIQFANSLDLTILHYALRDKKYMLDISKSVKSDYFAPDFQDFFGILLTSFSDPNIKDVLSLPAFLAYSRTKGLAHREAAFTSIYQIVAGFKIADVEPAASDFGFYLQQLKERYNAVVAEDAVRKVAEALNAGAPITEVNKIFSSFMKDAASIHKGKVFDEGTLGEDAKNMMLEYRAIQNEPEQFRGILTGISAIDTLTNGFFGGELIIVAGMEGTGKSALVMNWGVGAWLGSNREVWFSNDPTAIDGICENYATNGHNVVYFSLEMPRSNRGKFSSAAYLNKRLISCMSGLDFNQIRKGQLSPPDFERYRTACRFVKEYDKQSKMYVVDIPRGATTEDIEVKLLEIQEKFPVHMIIVDYLGLMAGGENDDDWEALGHIAEKLHELGRVYNIPVITPAQVNRPSGQGQSLNKQSYNTTRIGRSAMIGQNANIVFQIGCRDQEEQYTDMPLYIIKMRDSPKGLLSLTKDFARMRVYDAVPADENAMSLHELVDIGDADDEN